MSKSFSFVLTLNILWFSLSRPTCYDESVIHYGSVATHLRCGGTVNNRCVANFLEIVTVKEFLKSLIFDKVICVEHLGFTFWPTLYTHPRPSPEL